jgi:hypothetical protein
MATGLDTALAYLISVGIAGFGIWIHGSSRAWIEACGIKAASVDHRLVELTGVSLCERAP